MKRGAIAIAASDREEWAFSLAIPIGIVVAIAVLLSF